MASTNASPTQLFPQQPQPQQQQQQQQQQQSCVSKTECCDRMQHHQQFLSIINKVANWIATSDRSVCLFADDKSLSTLSPSVLSESGELERRVLAEQLQREAIERAAASRRHSSEKQVNNHNEQAMLLRKKREMLLQRKQREPATCGRNNRSSTSATREQQQLYQQDDPHLERVIQRASKQIRLVVYRLRAEQRLPENCNLRMRLSVGRCTKRR